MSGGWDVSVLGPARHAAFWNGAASYARETLRALALRGHRITVYGPDDECADPRWNLEPEGARTVRIPAADALAAARTAEEAFGADVVLLMDGDRGEVARLNRAIADAPRCGAIVFWDLDVAATLDRALADETDPIRELLPRCELVLGFGGGEAALDAYAALGAKRCVPIQDAFDPRTHRPVLSDLRFAGDLGVIANRVSSRESLIERLFLEPARRFPAGLFVLAGVGWDDRPLPTNVAPVGHVYERERDSFFASTRALLAIGRGPFRFGFALPHHVLAAAGCGACVITDADDGIEEFLEPNAEVLVARDGVAVAEHVRELTPTRAAAIGMLARRRMLSEHTYAHRARQIEDALCDAGLSARRGAA